MTFDYMYHLTKEEIGKPSSSEQWAGQYNRFIAVGKKKEKADPLREAWKNQYLPSRRPPGEVVASQEWQKNLGLSLGQETLPGLDSLPAGSFLIHFTFNLQKPYLSKDDNDFHIIDNPLAREKVFRWPMVRPSSWKGVLWHALWQSGRQKNPKQIRRIFGETRGDDTGQAGRLCLYPTFFNQSGLETINPHDRENRVGKNPILLECVPIGASGTFTLLYAPCDRIGKDERETRHQVAADLQLIAEGIRAMITIYGFGAKTSSGFGLAADQVEDGKVTVKIPGFGFPEEEAPGIQEPDEGFDKYLDEKGAVSPTFEGSGEGGLLSNKEYKDKGKRFGGGSLSEFKEFRQWYVHYGKTWREYLKTKMVESEYSHCPFEYLSDLIKNCTAIETDSHEVQEPIP